MATTTEKPKTQIRIKPSTRPRLESIRKVKGWSFTEAIDRITEDFIASGMKERPRRAS